MDHLNHSKTWPVSTLAVVQLRVNPHGQPFGSLLDLDPLKMSHEIIEQDKSKTGTNTELMVEQERVYTLTKSNNNSISEDTKNEPHALEGDESDNETTKNNGSVLLLSQKHLEIFTKMSAPSFRTLRTDTVSTILEQEFDYDHHETQELNSESKEDNAVGKVEKFHVLALTKIDEHVNENDQIGRRPSIKVDNWDYIYTETARLTNKCPVHSYRRFLNQRKDAESQETSVPELPLDARKTTTLRRHYYPEGGWGWIVIVCSVLVHVLNHGVQLSCSQLVIPGAEKFKVEAVHFAGKFLCIYMRFRSMDFMLG